MYLILRLDGGRRNRLQRGIRVALLAVYIITAAGVPLPSPPQKSGELFPCSASHCGCKSAERCWSSCCCHTLAERIAWARKHGVRPPAFAIAQARLARLNVSWLANQGPNAPAASPRKCCIASTRQAHAACCQKPLAAANAKAGHACCSTVTTESQPTTSAGSVIGWQALKCRGNSLNWLAAVPPLVGSRLGLSQDFPRVRWLGPTSSEHVKTASTSPATPPPESA